MNPEGLTGDEQSCFVPMHVHTITPGYFIAYPIINFNFMVTENWPVFCLKNA